jgi:hypothetical protein
LKCIVVVICRIVCKVFGKSICRIMRKFFYRKEWDEWRYISLQLQKSRNLLAKAEMAKRELRNEQMAASGLGNEPLAASGINLFRKGFASVIIFRKLELTFKDAKIRIDL